MKLAADQGQVNAAVTLAIQYMKGLGTDVSNTKALFWAKYVLKHGEEERLLRSSRKIEKIVSKKLSVLEINKVNQDVENFSASL